MVPREQLRDTAMEIANKIAAKSPAMIRIAKEALTGIEDGNLEDKYRWEQGFTLQAYMSPDSAETRSAFVSLPVEVTRAHAVTEQIQIEVDRLNLKEAA